MKSQNAENILNKIKKRKTPYTIRVLGFNLQIDKEVYPPGKESILLAKNLKDTKYGIKKGEKILDYGTGSGFLALVAAKLGGDVLAIDINPKAIKCSKKNIKKNNLNDRIETRISKSFKDIKANEIFDVVIANLPYENAKVDSLIEFAVYDPNFQMRDNLFKNIKKHFSKKGRIFFAYSERVQKICPIEKSSDKFNYKIIAKKYIDDELYFLYLITPK